MKLVTYLEKNKIATRETMQIFMGALFCYLLSWFLKTYNLSWMSFGFLLIALGGLGNLYVIDYNNFRMPVLGISRRLLKKFKKENPTRGVCRMNRQTKLAWLADRFEVGKYSYSLGDFIIAFGLVMIFAEAFLFIVYLYVRV